ncbi:MAG: four-carbon acid sugar kinase family protein, partial [Planctomycetes bacterium]|nr:four-carbon acid sugar kinase family protein [Planctomycetota bacterium]
MSALKIGVVADDLTGAMDTAGAFASRGLRARVLTRQSHSKSPALTVDVLCINTQTRSMVPALARAPVADATKDFRAQGFGRVYKKIDSTL